MHKLYDVRGGSKGNFMSLSVSMRSYRQTVRYPNPEKKNRVQPNISTFFYTRSHVIVPQNCKSFLATQFFIKFHIEIADDTFQFLDYVLGQEHLKNVLLLFCKLIYSFVAIDLKKCICPFLHLKEFTNLGLVCFIS